MLMSLLQGCRVEASCTAPLTLDIETDMSELHLEPVTISPYTLPGNGEPGNAADTSPKGREVLGERSNRKDSVRAGERQHPNKSHHGIKGKQQRDRRKLREKRRSTGVVHLASTESTGGSTSGEEELSECDVGTETKRNTAQNESIGDQANHGLLPDTGDFEARDLVTGERKNSGRGPHTSNSHNRARLRSKNVARSEDMEADDELVNDDEWCEIRSKLLNFRETRQTMIMRGYPQTPPCRHSPAWPGPCPGRPARRGPGPGSGSLGIL